MPTEQARVVIVEYVDSPGRKYDFFTDIPDLAIGDRAVAHAITGLGIVRVLGYRTSKGRATAWLVCKIDMVRHQERLARKSRLIDVKRRMADYVTGDNAFHIYRALAHTDRNMARMLDEFIDLGGTCDDIR